MKAGSRFLNAVSAVALSASFVTVSAGALVVSTQEAQAAVVRQISVRGAQRVGADAVRSNLTIVPGRSFNNSDIDESVKRLYATGFFSDVRINVSGGTLVVSVSENSLVNQVVFNGNRKIKDEKLAGLVRTRSQGAFSESLLEADLQSIRAAYAAIGRSDVTVTTQTASVGQGRVNVAFQINEGDRTKIADINFVGNQAYGDRRLRGIISTKESGIFTFLSRKDVYDQGKLRADEEALRQFYYNHGYPDFRVISSDATLNEATNEYTVTITVDEGERYTFGDVVVESTVDGIDSAELSKLVESRTGKTYDARDVQQTMSAIARKVASKGYPFARVTPRGNRDFATNTIGVEYLVDQGDRSYVERIEIRGNTRTRDYVIRREFDFAEGDAFNQEMISAAKRRLDRLGFFSNVAISTAPGSSPDRVVVIVDVQDQSTGSFGLGVGYATGGEGVILEASIEEKNFLGRGQFIRVSASGGKSTRNYNINFTEPYFLGYRLAAGFDVFRSTNSTETNYSYADQGFTLRMNAPITEQLSTSLSYTYRQLKFTTDSYAALSQPYKDAVDGSPWIRSSVTHKFTYNSLDNFSDPREGFIGQIEQEYAGLGGNSKYYKLSGRLRYYQLLSEDADIVGSLTVGAGKMWALGGAANVFDQFKIGGNEVRGFSSTGIGPRMSNGDVLGGTSYFVASAEATFPMPGFSPEAGIRGAIFADAGTLYGNSVSLGADTANGIGQSWRASVGASLIWASPFGPLRFDYAIPVKKQAHDEVERFKFGIQTSF